MRIIIPKELREYVRFRDGKLILKKEIPEKLTALFKSFQKKYEEDCTKISSIKKHFFDRTAFTQENGYV